MTGKLLGFLLVVPKYEFPNICCALFYDNLFGGGCVLQNLLGYRNVKIEVTKSIFLKLL